MTDSIDADTKRYATCDDDVPTKPVYRPGDDPLEFKRSVRFAAIDVMILTFAARRHAQWLNRIGVCPPDVAALIRQDVAYITNMLTLSADGAPRHEAVDNGTVQVVSAPVAQRLADVGPRSPRAAGRTTPTPSLFDARGGDVGQTGRPASASRQSGRGS